MAERFAAIMFFLLAGITAAVAQTDPPLMGSAASESADGTLSGSEVSDVYSILSVGDGVGGGLGAGLSRMIEADSGFEVTVRFNEESGIARPEVYDWSLTLPKILETKSYDAVVVLLGANDRQAIRSGETRLEFNSPEWIAAYKAQTDRILDVLKQSGARVFWVSLPPMADPDYDAAMRTITALQKERAEAKGARFIDIRSAFVNPDGSYTDTGPDDTGTVRKLRGRDGISFFKQGNNRLGQLVLAIIRDDMNGQTPDAKGSAPAGTLEAVTEVPKVPLFGQSVAGGQEATYRPDDVRPADVMAPGSLAGGSTELASRLAALRALSPEGSAAEALFSTGLLPPPPAGRIDDFAVSP